MPSNMTMKRPHPRIIRINLHNNIPLRPQNLDIPPLRIPRIDNRRPIPLSHTFIQHKHIMPV